MQRAAAPARTAARATAPARSPLVSVVPPRPARRFPTATSPHLPSLPARRTTRQTGPAPTPRDVAAQSSAAATPSGNPDSSPSIAQALNAFWKFLRPHTIRGTLLGTGALVARALMETPNLIDWALLPRALLGLLALLCGNGFIVGINQVYDVEIDRVNKPFLPVAAGELSKAAAAVLCVGLAAGGIALAFTNFGPFIGGLYSFGLFLGTIYSVPPLRLKRFPVPAFAIIATVRGFLLNFGVYYATRAALGLTFEWVPAIMFITTFVTVFATVIAITKDLPDIEGDRKHKIETFTTKYGAKAISLGATALLGLNYVMAIGLALTRPDVFRAPVLGASHVLLLSYLILSMYRLQNKGFTKLAMQNYYRAIWNLFYAEYVIFPFI
ncbi:unnamed protein product [Pedinophyceae sp. YPF-701]|nr:unnamed protein product [Pedinophyceae sp. YPF-701]